jgi:hypothetical protein
MQPSGAQGAHGFLVRSGDVGRKRKEAKSAAAGISRILSTLTCGFPRRHLAQLIQCTVHKKWTTGYRRPSIQEIKMKIT